MSDHIHSAEPEPCSTVSAADAVSIPNAWAVSVLFHCGEGLRISLTIVSAWSEDQAIGRAIRKVAEDWPAAEIRKWLALPAQGTLAEGGDVKQAPGESPSGPVAEGHAPKGQS